MTPAQHRSLSLCTRQSLPGRGGCCGNVTHKVLHPAGGDSAVFTALTHKHDSARAEASSRLLRGPVGCVKPREKNVQNPLSQEDTEDTDPAGTGGLMNR